MDGLGNILESRGQWLWRAVTTHFGKRDLWAAFGYKPEVAFSEYFTKYTRQDVATRVIDAPVEATWNDPPKVDGGNAAFNDAWEALVQEFTIWEVLTRADRLRGIGHFSEVMLGLERGDPSTPAGTNNKLIYLQPYSEASVSSIDFEKDTRRKRFGKPTQYNLQVESIGRIANPSGGANPTVATNRRTIAVHYTRIFHVCNAKLENETLGVPDLQKIYNLLDDLLKVTGGSSEVFWMNANRGMQVDVDKDIFMGDEDGQALEDEFNKYEHGLTRILKTRGVTINSLGADLQEPKGSFDMIMSLISGSTGIPKRILLGSEAGQLASDQDRANWAARVQERRTAFAEPRMLRPFIKQLQELGVLPATEAIEVTWPDAFKLTSLEQSQKSSQNARAASNYSRTIGDQPVMTREEMRVEMGLPPEPELGELPELQDPSESNPQGDSPNDGDEDAREEGDDSADEEETRVSTGGSVREFRTA